MTIKEMPGQVYLVGAGPGDPGLLTLKGKSVLEKADVLIYDYLVTPEILSYVKDECIKIYAGKKASNHQFAQEEINMLIVDNAKDGNVVVRLKGGDPFMFGRGGEEALFLKEHGIPFEIVPGVSAGFAVPAYAGIPLTHRSLASDIHFITGHEDPGKKETTINWEALAQCSGTLVFFMGVKNLPLITEMLRKYGKPGTTPAAVIRWGTYPKQTTVIGTIDTISERAEEAGMKPPAIIVFGDVVGLRPELRWYDNKPLFGKQIVVTRSRGQSSVLSGLLKDRGAEVVEFPTISIVPVSDSSETQEVLEQLPSFSWLIFTSVNGVDLFFKELFRFQYDARVLASTKIAVIGSATAAALENYGIRADLVPDVFTSEGLIEAFNKKKIDVSRLNILCPGSAISRDYIPETLRKYGASVRSLSLYETVIPDYSGTEIDELFSGNSDLFTFTSSSTVTNLVELLKTSQREHYLEKIKGAVIGPVTGETAEKAGISVLFMAKEYTIPGLVSGILEYFKRREE